MEKRIARLVAAIEAGGEASALVAKLRELEGRLKAIDAEARSLQPIPRLAPEVIENRLAEWRRLLRSSITQGRTVLQRVLHGRITFTPIFDRGYEFEAPTRFDRLFSGLVVPRSVFAGTRPKGTEGITPEDVYGSHPQDEHDYGRLLDAAALRGRGWCARRDSNPRPTGSKPVALSN